MKKFYTFISRIRTFFKPVRKVSSHRFVILLLLLTQTAFAQKLKLPFFDDFSVHKTSDTLWQKTGGASFNNSYGIGQPSVGIATFDGRNSAGIPYVFTNPTAYGYTDTLTSKSIDLSSASMADSLYLSFFGQAKGLGEAPDHEDSLLVYFKDKNNHWQNVWPPQRNPVFASNLDKDVQKLLNDINVSKLDSVIKNSAISQRYQLILKQDSATIKKDSAANAIDLAQYTAKYSLPQTTFAQQFVALKDPIFFHNDFQFRFQAKGRQSGSFDTWNIDYVYLNKNRTTKDIYFPDVAWQQIDSTFLKNYSAMPLRQYRANPANETRSSLSAEMYSSNKDAIFVRDSLVITVNGTLAKIATGRAGEIIAPQKTTIRSEKITPISVADNVNGVTVKCQFKLFADSLSKNSTINTAQNDTISHYTELKDYFAYDDGTAEEGANIDQKFGKVAVQFRLNKLDTVSAVRFNFMNLIKDVSGQYFQLQLYDNAKNAPNKLIFQKSVQIAYVQDSVQVKCSDSLATKKCYSKFNAPNKFYEYALGENVAVKDTFYVAWVKLSDDVVAVGLDKNSPQFAKNIYYNLGTDWIKNQNSLGSTAVNGSLMVRPVMGKRTISNATNTTTITATETINADKFVVFPNPTLGILQWNLPNISQIKIFDTTGKIVWQENIANDSNQINIESLEMGVYFVNFSAGNKNYSRKIVVVK